MGTWPARADATKADESFTLGGEGFRGRLHLLADADTPMRSADLDAIKFVKLGRIRTHMRLPEPAPGDLEVGVEVTRALEPYAHL